MGWLTLAPLNEAHEPLGCIGDASLGILGQEIGRAAHRFIEPAIRKLRAWRDHIAANAPNIDALRKAAACVRQGRAVLSEIDMHAVAGRLYAGQASRV